MKKLIAVSLALIIMISMSCTSAFSDVYLSKTEEQFVGAWSLCATSSDGTSYMIFTVFFDNMEVVQHSITYKDGKIKSDNKASGEWCGFTDKTIVFTLAGNDMSAMIKDDGYLHMYFVKNLMPTGAAGTFSRCEDVTSVLGW